MSNAQVRRRTLINNADQYSHVVEYGDMKINNDSLVTYIGADPANVIDDYGSYLNVVPTNVNDNFNVTSTTMTPTKDVGQRDARLIHLMHKVIFYCILPLQKLSKTNIKKISCIWFKCDRFNFNCGDVVLSTILRTSRNSSDTHLYLKLKP